MFQRGVLASLSAKTTGSTTARPAVKSCQTFTTGARLGRGVQLGGFPYVNGYGRPLGRDQVEAAQVLALRSGRLVADQRVHQRREVLVQRALVERHLADGHVHDAELVGPELHLATLGLRHSPADIFGYVAGVRVWRHALR